MKIAVLGSRGMLGTALMQCFGVYAERHGHDLVGFDRSATDPALRLDITDREQVFSLLSEMKPDVILNAAASTAVDDAEKNPELAMRVNGEGVRHLADFCRSGAGSGLSGARLVHFSTDYVFDGKKIDGYSERDIPRNPVNVYGASKLTGERALVDGNFYLVRTSWLFGPNGKNFVDTMLTLGAKYHSANAADRKPLRVVNDQIGKPTFTLDLARATLELIEVDANGDIQYPPGIYHLVNEGAVSWYEFAREIFEAVGENDVKILPVPSSEFPRPAARPAFSALNNTLFPKLRPHGEALREYLKLYKVKP